MSLDGFVSHLLGPCAICLFRKIGNAEKKESLFHPSEGQFFLRLCSIVVIVWVIVESCWFSLPREPSACPCSIDAGLGFLTCLGQWTTSPNQTHGLK